MRIATATRVTTGVLGIVAGIAGIAFQFHHQPPQEQFRVDVSLPVDLPIEPTSSSAIHEPPPPPEGPFYASLFVVGRTWTLPCTFAPEIMIPDRRPEITGAQRCRVESVTATAEITSARIACWFVGESEDRPAVNTYVMTPTGLYKAATAPSTDGEPMFTPHPVRKSLPKGWGYDEPNGPTWANAIVYHDGAWCTLDEFQSLDSALTYAECISPRGIVGLGHSSFSGLTERCGDVP